MTISTSILKSAEKSILKLFLDSNLTSKIIFKSFQGSTFDEPSGYNAEVFIEYSVTAIRTEKRRLGLPAPGELGIQGTEVNYLIQADDMPDEYSTRDLLVHDTKTYGIEKITKILSLAFKIEVQGV